MASITAAFIVFAAVLAARIRLLTAFGAVAALCTGLVTLMLGGVGSVGLLFLFFCSSNLLGLWHRGRKLQLGFEKGGRRDQWQVLANGGPAIIGLVVGTLIGKPLHLPHFGVLLFAAGLSEANADTWATEIGSAAGVAPRSIISGVIVPPGRSGGVTWPGTTAAAAGALLIGSAYAAIEQPSGTIMIALEIGIAGLLGSLVDSLLGATVQAQYDDGRGNIGEVERDTHVLARGLPWIRNDAVNFLAGLSSLLILALVVTYQK